MGVPSRARYRITSWSLEIENDSVDCIVDTVPQGTEDGHGDGARGASLINVAEDRKQEDVRVGSRQEDSASAFGLDSS